MKPLSKRLNFQRDARRVDAADRTTWVCDDCGAFSQDPQHCPLCDKEPA